MKRRLFTGSDILFAIIATAAVMTWMGSGPW